MQTDTAHSSYNPAQKKILIVEDDDLNMRLFCDLLADRDYEILTSRTAQEAWNVASTQHPSLILMDIQLPGGSGLDIAKWIKADDKLKDIPIVAITAFAMKGDKEKILQGGCEEYISKPIEIRSFLSKVDQFLKQ